MKTSQVESQKQQVIVTGPDLLLSIVREKEEIGVKEAANKLKVPAKIIEHWCETLEEADLLKTELTLKDKIIMSKDSHNLKRSFIRNLKSLNGKKSWDHKLISEKKQELNKKIKQLEMKIKESQSILVNKKQAKSRVQEINKKDAKLKSLELRLMKEKDLLEKRRNEIEIKDLEISKEKSELAKHSGMVNDLEKDIAKREKIQKNVNIQIKKELKSLEKKKQESAIREKKLSSKEKEIHTKGLDLKEKVKKMQAMEQYLEMKKASLDARETRLRMQESGISEQKLQFRKNGRALSVKLKREKTEVPQPVRAVDC